MLDLCSFTIHHSNISAFRFSLWHARRFSVVARSLENEVFVYCHAERMILASRAILDVMSRAFYGDRVQANTAVGTI